MSLCSSHRVPKIGCKRCSAGLKDLFPMWEEMLSQAEKVGIHVCAKCKFKFFKTTTTCPKCSFSIEKL